MAMTCDLSRADGHQPRDQGRRRHRHGGADGLQRRRAVGDARAWRAEAADRLRQSKAFFY